MDMTQAEKLWLQPIPTVFERGEDGIVVPTFTPGCEWTKQKNALVTIKIDGISTRIVASEPGKVKVQHKAVTKEGQIYYTDFDDNDKSPETLAVCEALQDNLNRRVGFYITYGKDIRGNPQQADFNNMIMLSPIDGKLLIGEHVHGIKRGDKRTVGEFYDNVRRELEAGDVEGIVFHLEEPSMCTVKLAQITRKDFGLPWPIPAQPEPANSNLLVYRGGGYGDYM